MNLMGTNMMSEDLNDRDEMTDYESEYEEEEDTMEEEGGAVSDKEDEEAPVTGFYDASAMMGMKRKAPKKVKKKVKKKVVKPNALNYRNKNKPPSAQGRNNNAFSDNTNSMEMGKRLGGQAIMTGIGSSIGSAANVMSYQQQQQRMEAMDEKQILEKEIEGLRETMNQKEENFRKDVER